MEQLNELIEKAKSQSNDRSRRFMLIDLQHEVQLITITVYPDGYHLKKSVLSQQIPRTIKYTSSVATPKLAEDACEFIENNLNDQLCRH